MARRVIERRFISPVYIPELIFHCIRLLFVLGRKVGTAHAESLEEPLECGCLFRVVYDFGEVEGRTES